MPDHTTTSAAAELGVSRRQVIKLIGQGRLQAVRFGRDWSVDGASVEAYKASRRKAGRPKTAEKSSRGNSSGHSVTTADQDSAETPH